MTPSSPASSPSSPSSSPSSPSSTRSSPSAPSSAAPSPASSSPAGVSIGDDLLSAGGEARPRASGASTGSTGSTASTASGDASKLDVDPTDQERLDRWVERLHAGIDHLADAAVPRLLRLQSGLRATRGTVRRQAGMVREDGEAWAESLRCTVREHPVKAIAVAAAFGLLLARLSR